MTMETDEIVRLGSFAVVFAIMASWELAAPKRRPTRPKRERWLGNLTILVFNPVSVRLLFPFLPFRLAMMADERGWGLLNNVDVPWWLAGLVSIVLLDLSIYLQHVLFHAIPTFWRLHMMHHADLDIDLTTGLRFHPIEIVLSMAIKLATVTVLGPPVMAILVFEVMLNATSMFNHSNVSMPARLDRVVRLFLVTPDMHRVHHSVIIRETNSNFGFNHPWWDRLFGTYQDQPAKGHEGMTIGLSQFRDPRRLTLPWLLALPFVGSPGRQPLNRH